MIRAQITGPGALMATHLLGYRHADLRKCVERLVGTFEHEKPLGVLR